MAKAKDRKRDRKCVSHRKQYCLSVGYWNMRTLYIEGRVETSVVRPMGRGVTVDRKAALMVHELKKYDVNITGISEMKWFGHDTYEVEGHVILHSG